MVVVVVVVFFFYLSYYKSWLVGWWRWSVSEVDLLGFLRLEVEVIGDCLGWSL
jgi:hypothetical protein